MSQESGRHLADVLALYRERGELSRSAVMDATGLSRSTANHRLAALVELGLIVPIAGGESTGGRPSSMFAMNNAAGIFLTADIGASGFVAAACNLRGTPLRSEKIVIDIAAGPVMVLAEVAAAFGRLQADDRVLGIGIGVPGPVVDQGRGVRSPAVMPGWDGFDVIASMRETHPGVPVTLQNDTNARAIAEARYLGVDNVISLKLGTGISSGLIFNGQIIRGAVGGAGDIGHTRAAVPTVDVDERPCRCGNVGCVETYASGWALAQELAAAHPTIRTVEDVTDLVLSGDPTATGAVRRAGRIIGEAVAELVSILNPQAIILSGRLSDCGDILSAGLRERVHQRTHPGISGDLLIARSELGEFAGVIGIALSVADLVFSPAGLDQSLTPSAINANRVP